MARNRIDADSFDASARFFVALTVKTKEKETRTLDCAYWFIRLIKNKKMHTNHLPIMITVNSSAVIFQGLVIHVAYIVENENLLLIAAPSSW